MLTNILIGIVIILLLLILSVLIEFYRVIRMIKDIEIVAEQVSDRIGNGEAVERQEFVMSQGDLYRLKKDRK